MLTYIQTHNTNIAISSLPHDLVAPVSLPV
jgi:hypothetical protein